MNLTLVAIAGFATCVTLGLLLIGPLAMELLFGDEFDYERGGLVLVGIGMGLYLAAATLNQALLAHARASQAAARRSAPPASCCSWCSRTSTTACCRWSWPSSERPPA